jgi:hypothetical protein
MRDSWGLEIVLVAGLLSTLALGCGDDDDAKSTGKGGSGGQGGSGGSSGRRPMTRGGTGGFSPSTGGTGGGPAIDSNEAAYGCKPAGPVTGGTLNAGAACCGDLGVCTANPSGPGSQDWGADLCSVASFLRCEPRAIEEDGGVASRDHCRMTWPGAPANAPSFEGRCVTGCFLTGSPIAQRITQQSCASGQYCAPCYNPIDGKSTGQCEFEGDAPQDDAPSPLVACGDGLGLCVPSYATGTQATSLSRLNCGEGELCAPLRKVANPKACFDRCVDESLGAGACVPNFLVPEILRVALMMGSCGDGELCAPCSFAGMPIGVCD